MSELASKTPYNAAIAARGEQVLVANYRPLLFLESKFLPFGGDYFIQYAGH